MTPDPQLRAGDSDRDATIGELREAFAQGRLTQPEFDERLGQAQQAKTYGELARITADLPATVAPSVPAPASEEGVERRRGARAVKAAWASWVGVSVMMVVIWGATWLSSGGGATYFWPVWVIGPWGAGLLIWTLNDRFGDR